MRILFHIHFRMKYSLPTWLCIIIGNHSNIYVQTNKDEAWNGFTHFCGNTIFTIRFSFTSKDSFGMIIQSESCKFALRENLSSSSRTAIFTCSRSPDHVLSFSPCLFLPFSLFVPLCPHLLPLFSFSFSPLPRNGNARRQVKPLKSTLL